MKIVAISDTHTKEPELPEGDVLIHAGDFSYRGSIYETVNFILYMEKQKEKFKHRIFISGNHDFLAQKDLNEFNRIVKLYDPELIYLQDSGIELEGIKFYGSPWTRTFNNWAFMGDEMELHPIWNKIPTDTDVLITHSPPYGILDLNINKEHCGSKTLYKRVTELENLGLHIFGHIHEAYGKSGKSVNAAIGYHNENKPMVIKI